MKVKSFSLKNLTEYCEMGDPKALNRIILPKIPNSLFIDRLEKRESKIELNKRLSFISEKPENLKKPETNESKEETTPQAPRLNINSNLDTKIILRKSIPQLPKAVEKNKVNKNSFSNMRNSIKSLEKKHEKQLSQSIEVKHRINFRQKTNPKFESKINPIDANLIFKKHINDYFDKVIKDYNLENLSPADKNEINIFDLYLDKTKLNYPLG